MRKEYAIVVLIGDEWVRCFKIKGMTREYVVQVIIERFSSGWVTSSTHSLTLDNKIQISREGLLYDENTKRRVSSQSEKQSTSIHNETIQSIR